jgi:hypothetical protein
MNHLIQIQLESINRLIEDMDWLDEIRKKMDSKKKCKIVGDELCPSLKRLKKRGYIKTEYHRLESRPSESYFVIMLIK